MTKKVSKKVKEEMEKKVAETFKREAKTEKKADRLTNKELKVLESGLTAKKYESFTKKHGFEYFQTFGAWKKNGYSIKKGSKGKALEMYTKTASGNWTTKTYYYFTFEQVEIKEQKAEKPSKSLKDYSKAEFEALDMEQKMALMPF